MYLHVDRTKIICFPHIGITTLIPFFKMLRRFLTMSISPLESMSPLSCDLFYDILKRLDGSTLATAACACEAFRSISKEETLWENVCSSTWPSTNQEDVKTLILSIGGFKKFYANCFPLIVNKQVPEFHFNDYYNEYPQEWSEAEYYGYEYEEENISPSDFISLIDIRYKDNTIFSKVLWGIPYSNGFNNWFYDCPFRMDLLGFNDQSDDAMVDLSIDRERRNEKLWQELGDNIKLSWILVNRKIKKAANLSSWSPIGGQKHFPTENDFLIRFGSVLRAINILPCQVAQCILTMKFRLVYTTDDGGTHTRLKLTELSMQLGDMDGSHVNGRNALLVLNEALICPKSGNYSEALESCYLYSRIQTELKEEKMRYENKVDRLWILGSITACATLCMYCL